MSISTKKLNLILYHLQTWYLTFYDRPLINQKFILDKDGKYPILEKQIKSIDELNIQVFPDEQMFINSVLEDLLNMSEDDLFNQIKNDDPIVNCKTHISVKEMFSFYSKKLKSLKLGE